MRDEVEHTQLDAESEARLGLLHEFPGLMNALVLELNYALDPVSDLAFARKVRSREITSARGLSGRQIAIYQFALSPL